MGLNGTHARHKIWYYLNETRYKYIDIDYHDTLSVL